MLDGMKRLEYALKNGPVPVYKAEELGSGSAQRRAFRLERAGIAKSVRVGKRRHMAAEPSDLLKTTVQDFEDLRRLLIALDVRPEMGLGEALAALEKRGRKGRLNYGVQSEAA